MEETTITPNPSTAGTPSGPTPTEGDDKKTRLRIGLLGLVLFSIFVVGLFWLATTPGYTVGLTLSFVAGLSMIFLPCTLPLAFVIVPMTLGKNPKKGLLMAVSFGLGLTITLSFYGVFIAALGKTFGLKSDAEVYAVLLGGTAAFLFGLAEIGLLKFKLPSYSGKFPDFIQRQKDYVKTFLLGLLLGNAGVGCPNPAFYLLLGYIATTADLFNGWILGFVHGLGRAVPLVFLAILGMFGVNALSGVSRHKETVERSMGWMLVIIGSYLLTFGIFGHDWFIASGIHGAWESFISNIGGQQFGEVVLKHEHQLVGIPNFVQYGNMFWLGFLAVTLLTAFAILRPSKKTIKWLTIIYIVIALAIGYSTGWTFKLGTNVHVQFSGEAGEMRSGEDGHMIGSADNEHGENVYHEERDIASGLAVNFSTDPALATIGTSTRLMFLVNEKPSGQPIEDLEIEQEKYMHVIGVRDDLNDFVHIHPIQTGIKGLLGVEHIFVNPGRYKFWSEVKRQGTVHSTGHEPFMVVGEGVKSAKNVYFGRNVIVGNYQVALSFDEPAVKNLDTDLSFEVHSLTGQEVDTENYLGVPMHLTIIKDDWRQFIHTHPEGNGDLHSTGIIPEARAHGGVEDEQEEPMMMASSDHGIQFHVNFPEAGLYRAFAQFRPKGVDLPGDEALMASFWIKVEEASAQSSSVSSWWVLLIVSLVLIVVLSVVIHRFLKAKPAVV